MSSLTIVSPRGTLTGSRLESELEFKTAQLRKSGGRRSFVDVVGTIEEETVIRILAAARLGARVVLLHPRWTEEERSRNLARIQNAPTAKRGAPTGDFFIFTSGTEGEAKAVELSAGGFEAHAAACAKRLPTSKSDRWLLTLTPAHVGGLAMILRVHFQGSTLVIPPSPIPRDLTKVVEANKVTHVSLVPTQLQSWMETASEPPKTLRCILLGGAACPPALEEKARSQGWPIRLTYGMTEMSSQVATQTADSPTGSVGPALPGTEVNVDPSGRLRVRGPGLMIRYLGDEAATKAALVDGWLLTPDLGRVDERGNVWILGRRDDMIVTGGENVDPREVEQALERHPAIAEACVVGVPDPKWGQTVVAVIVPKGTRPTAEELTRSLREHLADFKLPRNVTFWESLPPTATGKLQRAAVRPRLVSATVPR